MERNALSFLLIQGERKGFFISLMTHQGSLLFLHFSPALHPHPYLAWNQADISTKTTVTSSTASRITDCYGTGFCNDSCSSSCLKIKASCVSVILLQPGALSYSSLVSSAPKWHHGLLPSRTWFSTTVNLNAGRERCFFFPYPQWIPSIIQEVLSTDFSGNMAEL